MDTIKNKRHSNLDLLRIVSMSFIVGYHFLYWGGALEESVLGSFSYYFSWAANAFFHVMVNVFVMLSGYFLSEQRIQGKSIVKLELQVWLVSFMLYVFSLAVKNETFSFKSLLFSITPILSREYWFATNYFALLLLAPVYNILIRKMNDKQLKYTWFILVMLFSIITTVFFFSDTFKHGNAHGIVWFSVLYFTGAVLNKKIININKHKGLVLWILSSVFIFGFKVTMDIVSNAHIGGYNFHFLHDYSVMFYQYYSVPVYFGAIGMFSFFQKVNIRTNTALDKSVKLITPYVFYVYLIHDNNHFRQMLWGYIHSGQYVYGYFLPFLMIISVIGIFFGACILGKAISLIVSLLQKAPVCVYVEKKIDAYLSIIQSS